MRDAPVYEFNYIQNYDQNNTEKTLAGRFLQKSHKLLEDAVPADFSGSEILEVGAGTGNHLPFVTHAYTRYVMTDGSDQMLALAARKFADLLKTGPLVLEKQNATSLSYGDATFDRLIATHVLEHLPDPVSVLREWNRVVKPNGIISIVLPCDPGFLWRLGRYFGPRRNAHRVGLEYDYVQAVEHINSIYNLVVIIRHHFDILKESWFPMHIPLPDINLFYSCHLRVS